jgi:RNA polymerase sigma factor (sigma-70 family)
VAESLESLLERCRQGKPDAVQTLVARFQAHARQVASAILRNEHDEEDALQEAFTTALVRLAELKSAAAFPAWLRQIVRSKASRIVRRRQRPADELTDPVDTRSASPIEQVQHQELRTMVRQAMARLPPSERTTAELYYLEELGQEEIVDRLGVPPGTVRRRLHDARRRLYDLLLGYADVQPDDQEEHTRPIDPF